MAAKCSRRRMQIDCGCARPIAALSKSLRSPPCSACDGVAMGGGAGQAAIRASRQEKLVTKLACWSRAVPRSWKQADLLEPGCFAKAEHQIHVLHGLAGCALDEIIKCRAHYRAARAT